MYVEVACARIFRTRFFGASQIKNWALGL
jgi:hypothetical protein